MDTWWTGTFGRKGNGTNSNPYTADFTTGPDGPLGYNPSRWEALNITATEFEVRYQPQ